MFTVYALKVLSEYRNRDSSLCGLYTEIKAAEKQASINDMFFEHSEVIEEMSVYETIDEIPEEFLRHINSRTETGPTREIPEKAEGIVYGVIRNTEMAEGRGNNYVWMLASNPALAEMIAAHNGVCGCTAYIAPIPLNTYLEDLDDFVYWYERLHNWKRFNNGR